ncbi:GntR family transcriptional regulator [Mesobacterium pallidum]|uniref:GntR family transcriptional regulator n=1 Tax=Mesobacterium pallidum TaxID=2872037 RepID=UPI001EE31E56|nr:GntR family transcriptional regulator [Mesobacterium pallidum]
MDAQTLSGRIQEDIVFGVYPAGTKLTEERLIERYKASRYVLRAAMNELASQGLLVWIKNKGVQVAELTPDAVDDLYQVREILETSAARLTRLPADPALVRQLEDIQDEHEQAIKDRDFRKVFQLNLRLHARQYEACPNVALQQAIADHARKVHQVRGILYNDMNYFDKVTREHREIISALKGEDTEAYVAAVKAHLPESSRAYRQMYEMRHGVS